MFSGEVVAQLTGLRSRARPNVVSFINEHVLGLRVDIGLCLISKLIIDLVNYLISATDPTDLYSIAQCYRHMGRASVVNRICVFNGQCRQNTIQCQPKRST